MHRRYHRYGIIVLALFLAGCAAPTAYYRLDPLLQKDIKTFESVQYVPLIRVCDRYGVKWDWDPFVKVARLERGGKRLVLRAGSDRGITNGMEIRLDRPVMLSGGVVYIPASLVKDDLGGIIDSTAAGREPVKTEPGRFAIRTVVVDAGHGGKDAGAVGRRLRLKEKNLTLAIARKLKNILEENGIRVVMTRDNPSFVTLPRRVDIANKSGADLFVSIHVNASRSRLLKGFECYYLSDATDDNARALEAIEDASLKTEEGTTLNHTKELDATLWDMTLTENRRESAALAGAICRSVEGTSAIKNRGIRSARFYVLKNTRMPAVLVEMGYISNGYEEAKLNNPAFIDTITRAVADGILAYKREYERTEGYTE